MWARVGPSYMACYCTCIFDASCEDGGRVSGLALVQLDVFDQSLLPNVMGDRLWHGVSVVSR